MPPLPDRLSSVLLICPGCHQKNCAQEGEAIGQYTLYTCTACELTFSDPMRAASIHFYESNTEYDDKWEFKFLYDKIKQVLETPSCVLCNVEIVEEQRITPMLKFGAGLEDLNPKIPKEALDAIMRISTGK